MPNADILLCGMKILDFNLILPFWGWGSVSDVSMMLHHFDSSFLFILLLFCSLSCIIIYSTVKVDYCYLNTLYHSQWLLILLCFPLGRYLNFFYATPYAVILGNNLKTFSKVTPNRCALLCVEEESFVCRSFDYRV